MALNIEKLKQAKKEKGFSYDDLARITGYSRSTITNIFCGYIDLPRHDTVQAIESALGLNQSSPSKPKNQLFELIDSLNEKELEELLNYLDYILSRRKNL